MTPGPSSPEQPRPLPPRTGSGSLNSDFAAKAIKVPRSVPPRARPSRRWLPTGLFLGLLVCLAGGALAYHWRRSNKPDSVAQRQGLGAFLGSEDFSKFIGAADAELVAMHNFIASQPATAQAAFPEVEAFEQRERLPSWTLGVTPLATSAAEDPALVMTTQRALATQLAQRGFSVDPAAERAARQLFIRLLAPHARAFLQRSPRDGFSAIILDTRMQDEALAAFAARHNAADGVPDVVRIFALYAKVGPAMWPATDTDPAGITQAFSAFKS